MNIAIFCIFIASFLPIFFIGYAKVAGGFKLGHNHQPRNFLLRLEGKAFRAKSAHDNSWEAFAPFAAGVLACLHMNVPQGTVDALAISFIGTRIIYGLAYIYDKAAFRSMVWFVGVFITCTLFFKAWSA